MTECKLSEICSLLFFSILCCNDFLTEKKIYDNIIFYLCVTVAII